jgi:hypothetical protein
MAFFTVFKRLSEKECNLREKRKITKNRDNDTARQNILAKPSKESS